jgi:hypothetical protein
MRSRCFGWVWSLAATLLCSACAAQAPVQEQEPPHEQAPPAAEDAPPAPAAAEAPTEVEQWLARIEARAAELKTLQAKVRIAVANALTGDEQARFGRLIYDAGPPGRFSLHLDRLVMDGGRLERMDTWYVFDGRWLLERNHKDRQAVRRQIVPPDVDPAEADPLGLGRGPFPLPLRAKKTDVLARYKAVVVEAAEGDPAGTMHLRLTPRDGEGRIDLWYDRTTLLPVKVVSLAEDETTVTLTEPVTDEPVKAESFDTSLPTQRGWTTDVRPWEASDDGPPAPGR